MKATVLGALVLLFPLLSSAAQVARVEKLSCRAANGVLLESVDGTPYVQTSWFGFQQTFQLPDQSITSGLNFVRIPLGLKDKPATTLYDIYLLGSLEGGKAATLDGVIGQTLFGVAPSPAAPNSTPWPLAFRPIAAIRCELVGQ